MKNKIYILHENDEWVEPLRKELQAINAPFEEWHLGKRNVDHLDKPPYGIFYNRMSASSHTRGHRYAPDVNTNTNYNSQAEKNSEIKGMRSIAKFLKEELLLLSNIRVVA